MNRLYFGDNLAVLQQHVASESVDLIYLDPPFNKKSTFNILYKSPVGEDVQRMAFEDTWRWEDGAEEAMEGVRKADVTTFRLLLALQDALGQSDLMAYLAMMAVRLIELRRVLKSNGSLYLHCDPTASHYLKIILDAIFGPTNFTNEIVWKRSDAHNDAKQGAKHFGRVHDTILFYRKSEAAPFHVSYRPLPETTVERWYRHVEEGTGRRYN